MIVTTILTLTLLMGQPDALVQVFSSTQAVTITKISENGCAQVDPFWIQCWGADANGTRLKIAWKCNDPLAVITMRVDNWSYLYEMRELRRCLSGQYLPVISTLAQKGK